MWTLSRSQTSLPTLARRQTARNEPRADSLKPAKRAGPTPLSPRPQLSLSYSSPATTLARPALTKRSKSQIVDALPGDKSIEQVEDADFGKALADLFWAEYDPPQALRMLPKRELPTEVSTVLKKTPIQATAERVVEEQLKKQKMQEERERQEEAARLRMLEQSRSVEPPTPALSPPQRNPGATSKWPEKQSLLRSLRQISKEPAKLVECTSCLDEFLPLKMVKLPCHSYCSDCFVVLVKTAMQTEAQFPPKCCSKIPQEIIYQHIPRSLKESYAQKSAEWKIPPARRYYCAKRGCGMFVVPGKVNRALRRATCARGHSTCTMCRGPSHGGKECPEDKDLDLTKQLAKEEGWKKCPKCSALVEHKEACHHMTCLCGHEFCYICIRRWHTCDCTTDMLEQMKEFVASRKADEARANEEEEADMQEALRQIAELELLEATRKARRTQAIEAKYQQLQASLSSVHHFQRQTAKRRQQRDQDQLRQEQEQTLAALEQRHAAERRAWATANEAELAGRQQELDEQYNAIADKEFARLEEYHGQLCQQYYAGSSGSSGSSSSAEHEAQVRAYIDGAMAARRDKSRRKLERLDEARRQTLGVRQRKVGRRQAAAEEGQQDEGRRVQEQFEERWRGVRRQAEADLMWLAVMVVERKTRLGRMEEQERGGLSQ